MSRHEVKRIKGLKRLLRCLPTEKVENPFFLHTHARTRVRARQPHSSSSPSSSSIQSHMCGQQMGPQETGAAAAIGRPNSANEGAQIQIKVFWAGAPKAWRRLRFRVERQRKKLHTAHTWEMRMREWGGERFIYFIFFFRKFDTHTGCSIYFGGKLTVENDATA